MVAVENRSTACPVSPAPGMRLLVALTTLGLLAACTPGRSPERWVPNPGPDVDQACLDHARHGSLVPHAVGALTTTGYRAAPVDGKTLTLRHDGRPLTEAELATFRHDFFPKGMAMSRAGHPCPAASVTSCIDLEAWLCQTSLDGLAAEVEQGLARAGAADAELVLTVRAVEMNERRCAPNTSCPPQRHDGSPPGGVDPALPRRPVGSSAMGRCEKDGDCASEGNTCVAWYLAGAAHADVAYVYDAPTFCGCVARTCAWFRQD